MGWPVKSSPAWSFNPKVPVVGYLNYIIRHSRDRLVQTGGQFSCIKNYYIGWNTDLPLIRILGDSNPIKADCNKSYDPPCCPLSKKKSFRRDQLQTYKTVLPASRRVQCYRTKTLTWVCRHCHEAEQRRNPSHPTITGCTVERGVWKKRTRLSAKSENWNAAFSSTCVTNIQYREFEVCEYTPSIHQL